MILEFSITNFGPINDEVMLSFEATSDKTLEEYYVCKKKDGQRILKMGIIYGPNASGKSTLLQALEMLRDLVISPLEQKDEKIEFNKFLLNEKCKSKPTNFRLKFYVGEVQHVYNLELNEGIILNEDLVYYPNNRPAKVFSRTTKDDISELSFGSTINMNSKDKTILEGNTLTNNTVLGSYSKSNIAIDPFEKVYDWFRLNLTPIISPHHSLFNFTSDKIDNELISKSKVVNLLQNADLNIIDLEVIDEEIKINESVRKIIEVLPMTDEVREEMNKKENLVKKNVIFKHELKDKDRSSKIMELDKEWESSGTLRYYGLTGAVLTAIENDKILFIDEFDSSLHSDLMKHLILYYLSNSSNSQLLFTTHNLNLLNERDILRNDAIWFTQKNRKGAVELFSLAEFKSENFRKEGSIFNAYILGKLGAKPNVTGTFFK